MQRVREMLGGLRGGRAIAPNIRRSSVLPEDQEQEIIDREMFSNLWNQRKLLPPTKSNHATFRRKWFKLLVCLMLYELAYIPMQLSFQIPRADGPNGAHSGHFELPWIQVFLQWCIDGCFWADMMMEFRTVLVGPPEQGSILITDSKVISHKYLHGRFPLDLFAVFPFDIFCVAAPEGGLQSLASQFFRINRMFHVFRVVSYHGSAIAKLPRVSAGAGGTAAPSRKAAAAPGVRPSLATTGG